MSDRPIQIIVAAFNNPGAAPTVMADLKPMLPGQPAAPKPMTRWLPAVFSPLTPGCSLIKPKSAWSLQQQTPPPPP